MKIFRTFVLMLAALAMASCSMPGYTGGQLPTDSLPVATTEVAVTATLADTATPEPPTLTPTITETPTPEFTPTLSTPLVSAIDKNVLCRFGPGMEYGPSGSGELVTGVSAPILGKNDTVTWWQITNPKVETLKCWVDVNLTSASGDLASVPVVKDPLPFVTKAKVSASPSSISVPGCMGPIQPLTIKGTITVIGPTQVKWHFETQQGGALPSQVTVFGSFGSQDVSNKSYTPPVVAGTYWVRLVIESPNKVVAEGTYKIACP
jgi:hypothetical protein